MPSFNSSSTHLVDVFQEIKEGTRAPSLGVARVAAELPILVCQLRDSSPRVLLNVVARAEKTIVEVMERLRWILSRCLVRFVSIEDRVHIQTYLFPSSGLHIEVEVCSKEESKRPTPFRSLMSS